LEGDDLKKFLESGEPLVNLPKEWKSDTSFPEYDAEKKKLMHDEFAKWKDTEGPKKGLEDLATFHTAVDAWAKEKGEKPAE